MSSPIIHPGDKVTITLSLDGQDLSNNNEQSNKSKQVECNLQKQTFLEKADTTSAKRPPLVTRRTSSLLKLNIEGVLVVPELETRLRRNSYGDLGKSDAKQLCKDNSSVDGNPAELEAPTVTACIFTNMDDHSERNRVLGLSVGISEESDKRLIENISVNVTETDGKNERSSVEHSVVKGYSKSLKYFSKPATRRLSNSAVEVRRWINECKRKLIQEKKLVDDHGASVKLHSLERRRMRSTASIEMSRTQAALMSVSKRIFAVSLSPENCVTLERSLTSCSEDNKKTKIAEKKINQGMFSIMLPRKKSAVTQERSSNYSSDDTTKKTLPRKNSVTQEHSMDLSPKHTKKTKTAEKKNQRTSNKPLPRKNSVTLEQINNSSLEDVKSTKIVETKVSELGNNTMKVLRKRRHSTTPAPRKEAAIQPRLRHTKSLNEITNTEIVDGLFTTTLCSTEL
ncbi:hypothetical protein AWC38_SpisGene1969 [Stylophora pistillata]|uniref:Uncharacterized protein n=1 Tax=Stylophora pistillata TaxID=50429 RepID=A0A2B4SWA3_STYPI|nr:hypothetical protein AWC38_SpisGene1969 [Stylophora pistillata]